MKNGILKQCESFKIITKYYNCFIKDFSSQIRTYSKSYSTENMIRTKQRKINGNIERSFILLFCLDIHFTIVTNVKCILQFDSIFAYST